MPSEAKAAAASLRKLMGSRLSLCRVGFNSSKCKTEAKLAVARIKLLRNKREVQVRQMRRDVAMLLEGHQDSTARIRVEHVIREHNIMAANEIIELFCELIVARLPIIAKQRDCPPDLKEGISSLIFAAPRCSDIPELSRLRDVFEKKYGKDFVSAATDLRPESGVNRTLIEKLSVRTPSGEVKLKFMKEIAKEYQIEWDTTESELELLKPPEEPLKGPHSFLSASSMPAKPSMQSVYKDREGTSMRNSSPNAADLRSSNEGKSSMQFKDSASAAQAAMELAEQATAAAQAAAHLARRSSQQGDYVTHLDNILYAQESSQGKTRPSMDSGGSGAGGRHLSDDDEDDVGLDRTKKKIERRHSCNARAVKRRPEIRFDDSDGLDSGADEEVEEVRRHSEGGRGGCGHPPPDRPPPVAVSRVHPKLPDYEELTARFDALRRSRS